MKTIVSLCLLLLVSCNGASSEITADQPNVEASEVPSTKEMTEASTATVAPQNASTDVSEGVLEGLSLLGLNAESGYLAWQTDQPATLVAEGPGDSPLADLRGFEFQNFVLSADIAWTMAPDEGNEGGIGGCGIAFRAQDNFSGEVLLFSMQLQPLVSSWNLEHWDGSKNQTLLGGLAESDLFGNEGVYDDSIKPDSNHVLLFANAGAAIVYVNGRQLGSEYEIGEIALPYEHGGGIAFYPWSNSGTSTCTMTNVWVWEINS